jgi:hypothetical protein
MPQCAGRLIAADRWNRSSKGMVAATMPAKNPDGQHKRKPQIEQLDLFSKSRQPQIPKRPSLLAASYAGF